MGGSGPTGIARDGNGLTHFNGISQSHQNAPVFEVDIIRKTFIGVKQPQSLTRAKINLPPERTGPKAGTFTRLNQLYLTPGLKMIRAF